MTYETIKYEVADRILTITLNRPDRLNAFSPQMNSELVDAIETAEADDEVRVVVVTGEGRGFCAGADLEKGGDTFKHGQPEDDFESVMHRDGGGQLNLRFFESIKPMIAAINGPAVGIGATMTLPMDIRIMSEEAKMGFVFARRGIVPDGCASWFLSKLVGVGQALEWVLSGRVFPASEALKGGLVRSLHPADELLPEAYKLAREIAENTSAVSVALSRQMIWRMSGVDHPMEAHKIESRGVFYSGRSKDAKEGVTSFLEKRKPDFTGSPTRDMPPHYPWWKERPFE
ncbi:MAG: crotonase/enoyl-CoA hydratase family protein [Proteobacteria bacterium]|nr:crotonase/enoyl-CoA hydratase family protein [Pseudomonadota bacterium]